MTTGNFKDLMQAGRMDIVCHFVINSLYISNAVRDDVKLNLFFYGPPTPPRHLEIGWNENISKKDIAGLIKRMLYKYKKDKKNEPFPNCFIDNQSLLKFVDEKIKEGREVYVLDGKGENVREIEIGENPIFIVGDHEGFPQKEFKRIKKNCKLVSVGKKTLFASQVLTVLQNELDYRGI